MIRADRVTFDYPGVRALDAVSFSIRAGTTTALVGPNGAGKTTLLRCIAALDEPLAGRLEVDGVDVVAEPRRCHRRIGFLADNFGLYGALSVRRCLHYAAASSGLEAEAIPTAIDRVAQDLEITARLADRAGTLSRGQRQRVAIAQAIIHAPPVLILDEPASGLDPEARHDLAALFRRLHAQGMTLLVSSHILAELEAYCTDMLVLRAGRVVEHTALGARAPARVRLRLDLARPHADLTALLAAIDGVSDARVDGTHARLEFDAAPAARADMLARLIYAGVPICGLAEERANLQDSYLATVRGAARGAGA
ncbi:MAG: ABC transporter ATP-binding protein [Gammaproteobacteria bacterium]